MAAGQPAGARRHRGRHRGRGRDGSAAPYYVTSVTHTLTAEQGYQTKLSRAEERRVMDASRDLHRPPDAGGRFYGVAVALVTNNKRPRRPRDG